jgi:formiminoglutamate deiminase
MSRSGVWFARWALLPGGLAADVRLEVAGGRFVSVTPGATPGEATPLPGIVVPGMANAHSHAFHRALRGRTHDAGGTFWTWRRRMYSVAAQLDPDSYLALARAVYAEMALAGITSVGEFHYLHHAPGGASYDDPNVMGHALASAAEDAGIRLGLLDTCYLTGGLGPDGHLPLDDVQARFADGDAEGWAHRVAQLPSSDRVAVGAAVHSVRAVPRDQLLPVAQAAGGRPLHVHLSEQPAENAACTAFYGRSPTALLDDAGLLRPTTTAVHATHLQPADIAALGRARTTVCLCPTTERDLADGIGPARALRDAGCGLSLGTDQQAVVDLFEEARGLEMHERLSTQERGRFTLDDLWRAMTAHASVGFADAGALIPGARADLVAIRLDTPRTAGADPAQVALAATGADVDTVVVDGRVVVADGHHVLGDVGQLLNDAIGPLWETC